MAKGLFVLTDLSYGRNDGDPPLALSENAVVEARNVNLSRGRLAKKRAGCAAVSSGTLAAGPRWMLRHNAGAEASLDELFAGDNGGASGVILRNPSGTGTWAAASPGSYAFEYPAANMKARGVSFNGKLFLAYDSHGGVDRLHVWDGTNLRRVGLPVPAAAPTVANQGSGTYAAVARYYKVAWTVQVAGATVRRSELSAASTVFTPSGTGAAARVTRPTAAGEGETHWELYGSAAGTTYVLLATTVIATTYYDDSTAPSAYSGTAEPLDGTNEVPKSCAYILTDDTRLLLACEFESGHRSRVYFTPVLGASDVGDDERIPNTIDQQNWIDLDDKDGEPITGLGGPIFGQVIVFKKRHMWKLIPTGNALVPYRALKLSDTIGAVCQDTIVLGEDELGNPALYFLSFLGPFRWGVRGLEYLGRDLETLWDTVTWTNLGADFHGVYYQHHHEVWWWVNTSAGFLRLRLNTREIREGRGGWVVDDGDGVTAPTYCSVMYLPSLTAVSSVYVPYSGGAASPVIYRHDSGVSDAGTNFRAYVKTKPYALGTFGRLSNIENPILIATAAANAAVTLTLDRDFGTERRTGFTSLVATGSQTRVQRKLEDLAMNGVGVIQWELGDTEATNQAWSVDAVIVPFSTVEPR